jgi:hypothetical protein
MNMCFGTATHKRGKKDHARNVLLGSVRSAILRNRAMSLRTNDVDKWCDIIRKEFPEVSLRKDSEMIYINEKSGI